MKVLHGKALPLGSEPSPLILISISTPCIYIEQEFAPLLNLKNKAKTDYHHRILVT